MSRLLLKGGYLLDPSLEFGRSDILIEGDTIAKLGGLSREGADEVIDLSGKVVMPGLISAHSHTCTVLDRGFVDNLPLEPWQFYTVLCSMDLTPRQYYVATALGATEYLRTGTTALLDHIPTGLLGREEELAAIIQAFIDVGLRVVVAPSYSDIPFRETMPLHLLPEGLDLSPLDLRPAPSASQIVGQVRRFLERCLNRHERVTPALGPASPHRCSEELMRNTVDLAREHGVAIHSHMLESRAQVFVSQKRLGPSTGEFLRRIGCLGPHVSFAHAVWVNDTDISILAESGCHVVHNPPANMRLGSGVAPIQAMRQQGLNVALGADGPGGNDSQNMFEVMKYAALMHKLYGSPSRWLSAGDALELCLTGGSKVLRQKVGSLRPGYLADLTVLKMDQLFLMPKENFVAQVVYGESGSSVDTVLVGGQVIVEGGVVRTVDITELKREAQEIVDRMYAEIGSRRRQFLSVKGVMDQIVAAVREQALPYSRYAAL